MKFAVVGFVFLIGVGTLLWISIAQAGIKALHVRDVRTQSSGEECRVDNGLVVSIEQTPGLLKFRIRDDKDSDALLDVVTRRNPPDNLKVGGGVGLRGVFDRSAGVFRAEEVTTKCPSKYEGEAPGDEDAEPPVAPPAALAP